jgi:hypothetical protein
MAENNGGGTTINEPPLSPDAPVNLTSQNVKPLLFRLQELLEELDGLGLPKAAAYLSMAIDQLEADFKTETD